MPIFNIADVRPEVVISQLLIHIADRYDAIFASVEHDQMNRNMLSDARQLRHADF